MPAAIVRLPDGQNFTVTPVFAGLFFKSHELNTHHNTYPIGWTVVLHTEDDDEDDIPNLADDADDEDDDEGNPPTGRRLSRGHIKRPHHHVHSFTKPTLQNDSFFISSLSTPSSNDYKPPASPTRQIALMIYITLYWYFHQPMPSTFLATESSRTTPDEGKPRGEWRINVKREGVLRGRNLIPKLERMGLLANMNSAVGVDMDDAHESWAHMFVSRRTFWQIPARLFLFTLQPNAKGASSYPGSPANSRPGSPVRNESPARLSGLTLLPDATAGAAAAATGSNGMGGLSGTAGAAHASGPPTPLISVQSFPIGPFFSASHLPTYFPPPALQYTISNHVRHPLRPKPPRMGEVFYTRYVPTVGQYLAFRVASLSPRPVSYLGPMSPTPTGEHAHLATLSDTSLLQIWMAKPRVSKFWGSYSPDFLANALKSRHSFPVIAMWDGVPFGYFEVYWVREDVLGRLIGNEADDWDRGFHVIVGEDWARGRVPLWVSSMVHWILCADYRTMSVCIEPRIDNEGCVALSPPTPKLRTTSLPCFQR
jgi:hypothetical protein